MSAHICRGSGETFHPANLDLQKKQEGVSCAMSLSAYHMLYYAYYMSYLCLVTVCKSHAMLCYPMLCYAMLCMLCYVCYAMLCYVCYAMYAILCYAMLYYAVLCYAMLYYAMLCYAMYAMLCCILQDLAVPYHLPLCIT